MHSNAPSAVPTEVPATPMINPSMAKIRRIVRRRGPDPLRDVGLRVDVLYLDLHAGGALLHSQQASGLLEGDVCEGGVILVHPRLGDADDAEAGRLRERAKGCDRTAGHEDLDEVPRPDVEVPREFLAEDHARQPVLRPSVQILEPSDPDVAPQAGNVAGSCACPPAPHPAA